MSGTFDFAGLVHTTDHRDAGLFDLIERFTELDDTSNALISRAERLKEDGRAYKRLWREALASHDERLRLEKKISLTKAQTKLGVISKMNLWLELTTDNAGSMWDLPRAAIEEARAMLGGVD